MATDHADHDHAWASVGTTSRGETVMRVWLCERCRAWTLEPLAPDTEVAWADTTLTGE
jgi:hypothetical protein